jgi:ABC-type antimicrobial peptide transport system ATPase subunit
VILKNQSGSFCQLRNNLLRKFHGVITFFLPTIRAAQSIALARVLVLEPQALLMAERFSALDAISRERLQDELLDIWQRQRISNIFVTHNVEKAAYLAGRIIPPKSK